MPVIAFLIKENTDFFQIVFVQNVNANKIEMKMQVTKIMEKEFYKRIGL